MKRLLWGAAIAVTLSSAALAADITGGQRQFNLECKAQWTGPPVRQTVSIDLDHGRAWFVEKGVGSNVKPGVFPVSVVKGKIDLKGNREDELANNVAIKYGQWSYREKGWAIFGVCTVAPYTPIPDASPAQ